MRLVAGVLALILFAPLARGEDAKALEPGQARSEAARRKIPLRVVRVMPESHQALLFDRSRKTHVLAEVGGNIDGYAVEDIDDDQVTLRFEGTQIVLAAPEHDDRRHDGDGFAAVRTGSAAQQTDADGPTGDRAPDRSAPIDPYADPAIRVVQAPSTAVASRSPRAIEPGDDGVRVVRAPDSPTGSGSGSSDAMTSVAAAAGPPESGPVTSRPMTSGAAAAGPIGSGSRSSDARSSGAQAAGLPESGPVTSRAMTPGTSVAGPPVTSALATSGSVSAAVTSGVAAPVASSRATGSRTRSRTALVVAPPPRSTADQQTDDARAMADLLAGGGPARNPRKPRIDSSPTAPTAPETPAASSATPEEPAPQPTSEVRASTGDPTERVTLTRTELDAALADFAKLTLAMHGSFTGSGALIDGVSDGTIFQRIGLRAGDLITVVDGARLRTLDDAANVYARAASAKTITAQIVRNGKPVTLRVAIR